MSYIENISFRIVQYFQNIFFDGSSRLHSIYLISAFVLAIIAYWRLDVIEDHGEDKYVVKFRRVVQNIFNKDIWLHGSAIQDYKYFFVNALLYYGLITQFLFGTDWIATIIYSSLNNWFGVLETPIITGLFGIFLLTLVVILIFDFSVYLAHYVFHFVSWLWPFHAVHHSAEVLTPITLFRMHPVDLFITSVIAMFFNAIGFGLANFLMATPFEPLTILGLNIVTFFFYLFGYNLRHSQIWLDYPRWLGKIFISPAQHQIHHSSDSKHFDKNLGLIFSFWDQIFGTHYLPEKREELQYGLEKNQPNPHTSLELMYLKPFL